MSSPELYFSRSSANTSSSSSGQIYDENGNLINPDSDPGASYPQTQEPPLSRQYRNGLHLVENKKAAAGESDDMSQYNTINLQKVVVFQ
mgnify:CR=1 FL=1